MARTHVILPDDLLEEIDKLVGKRKRSAFLADAVEKELRRRRRVELGAELANALHHRDIPGWETEESTQEWVRKMRESRDLWSDDGEGRDKGADGSLSA